MAPTRIGLPDISMTQMEYLVAVQETSTWANAARIRVSQSALSQGLANFNVGRIELLLGMVDGHLPLLR